MARRAHGGSHPQAPPTPFAISLFFAGISTRLHGLQARAAILGLGCAVFVTTLPAQITS